jgi:uncharacterized membrane protein YtjA (UPF0391 family)
MTLTLSYLAFLIMGFGLALIFLGRAGLPGHTSIIAGFILFVISFILFVISVVLGPRIDSVP